MRVLFRSYADLCAVHFFGELAAIDNEPRSASVVARTDCLLASIPPAEFIALLRHHPEMMLYVLRRLASVIRICDERIMDLATLGAMQRAVVELISRSRPAPALHGRWRVSPAPPHSHNGRNTPATP